MDPRWPSGLSSHILRSESERRMPQFERVHRLHYFLLSSTNNLIAVKGYFGQIPLDKQDSISQVRYREKMVKCRSSQMKKGCDCALPSITNETKEKESGSSSQLYYMVDANFVLIYLNR